jgi:glycosyltransferase involved in cell wall biosynthesis
MSEIPKVSVVMPALNAEKFVSEAIDSILGQTLGDLEFIIINDGSTDGTAEILESYRLRNPRISVHTQNNSGVATAMNVGCQLARGKYIARMDADDISLPQRLAKQVAYLSQHAEMGICGTWMETFWQSPQHLVSYPTDPDLALCTLPFQMPLIGGSVMFDRRLYSERRVHYNPNVGATDDYLFIVECSKYCRVSSVSEVLYRYRCHPLQVTKVRKEQQHKFAKQIRQQQLEELGVQPTEDEINVHESISTWQVDGDQDWVKKIEAWLVKLKSTNLRNERYPKGAFAHVLADYWFATCTRNARLGLWSYKTFFDSPLAADSKLGARRRLKFLAKCVAYSFN